MLQIRGERRKDSCRTSGWREERGTPLFLYISSDVSEVVQHKHEALPGLLTRPAGPVGTSSVLQVPPPKVLQTSTSLWSFSDKQVDDLFPVSSFIHAESFGVLVRS